MLRALSTHVFLTQRLHPGLLDLLERGGAQAIELFGARQHFDYTSRQHIKETADWFASKQVEAHSLHGPMYPDMEMGRSGAPAVNVVHSEKSRRIEAMDEVKRALEVAEVLPFRFLVLHLGERDGSWSERTLEDALTAVEHLQAFARPLGVRLLLENIQNEITQPQNLREIIRVGHFTDVGVCFDSGHAHLDGGTAVTVAELKPLIGSTHLHDNGGDKDTHLWPGEGTIDWQPMMDELRTAPRTPAALLEIHYNLSDAPETVATKAAAAFAKLGV
jgi:sugar phosphate isomerase/epimerase